MARNGRKLGTNIIVDPRRPEKICLRIYHGGRFPKRLAFHPTGHARSKAGCCYSALTVTSDDLAIRSGYLSGNPAGFCRIGGT